MEAFENNESYFSNDSDVLSLNERYDKENDAHKSINIRDIRSPSLSLSPSPNPSPNTETSSSLFHDYLEEISSSTKSPIHRRSQKDFKRRSENSVIYNDDDDDTVGNDENDDNDDDSETSYLLSDHEEQMLKDEKPNRNFVLQQTPVYMKHSIDTNELYTSPSSTIETLSDTHNDVDKENTENHSIHSRYRKRMISPFSKQARILRKEERNYLDETKDDPLSTTNVPSPSHHSLTLAPCRKVSVIVRVKPLHMEDDENSNNDNLLKEEEDDNDANISQLKVDDVEANTSRCLFPLVDGDDRDMINDYNKANNHPETGQLVIVNPTAFGNFVSMEVTVAAARAAAVLKDIPSEDWTRRYHFDDVLWPNFDKRDNPNENVNRAISSLANAVIDDALSRKVNSTLFAYGQQSSGKTYTLFGQIFSQENQSSYQNMGLLGIITEGLLSHSNPIRIRISFLEIIDEETFRDLLSTNDSYLPRLKIVEHTDKKGAFVKNLKEVIVDSLETLSQCCKMAQIQKSDINHGSLHILVNIKIDLGKDEFNDDEAIDSIASESESSVIIQLIDLANSSEYFTAETNKHKSKTFTAVQERKAASIRKSIASLGALLRSLIINHSNHNQANNHSTFVSFRESTLTRLLKRSLDQQNSRAVMIATVCPSKQSYFYTLQTLNYVNRLIRKPGHTAQSPFPNRLHRIMAGELSPASPNSHLSNTIPYELTRKIISSAADALAYKHPQETIFQLHSARKDKKVRIEARGALLENTLADPRQRLAQLMATIREVNNNVKDVNHNHVSPITSPFKRQLSNASPVSVQPSEQSSIGFDFDFSLLDRIEEIGKPKQSQSFNSSDLLHQIKLLKDEISVIKQQHDKDKGKISSLTNELQDAMKTIHDINQNDETDKQDLLMYLEQAERTIEIQTEEKDRLSNDLQETKRQHDSIEQKLKESENEKRNIANEFKLLGNDREHQLNETIKNLRDQLYVMKNENENLKKIRTNDISNEKRPIMYVTKSEIETIERVQRIEEYQSNSIYRKQIDYVLHEMELTSKGNDSNIKLDYSQQEKFKHQNENRELKNQI